MGKNSYRESLIRTIVNTIVHEILAKHTNRPESKHFLDSEIIEYEKKTKKISEHYNWNSDDKKYVWNKALEKSEDRLANKYPDVIYSKDELTEELRKIIEEIM